MEDWSTVDYNGVDAEYGIIRSHVLNTSSVVIDLTICCGRATLKH
jgi:hypothetical protein